LVEQRTENPCVGGSIPSITTNSHGIRFRPSPRKSRQQRDFLLMKFTVYILQSDIDGSFYIGQTENLLARLEAHNLGRNISTKNKRPWKLKWYTIVDSRAEAMAETPEVSL